MILSSERLSVLPQPIDPTNIIKRKNSICHEYLRDQEELEEQTDKLILRDWVLFSQLLSSQSSMIMQMVDYL